MGKGRKGEGRKHVEKAGRHAGGQGGEQGGGRKLVGEATVRGQGGEKQQGIEVLECQAFFPVVRIGSPHPLTPQGGVAPSPFGPHGGRTRLRCEGVGGPNSD
jgi:hypothetical protein